MTRKTKVHFMGIGGSGMSGVAQIAHAYGYEVSGCDLNLETPYIDQVKKLGITVSSGHSPDHLEGIDILAVTPAAFYQNDHHPELVQARQKDIVMKWQQFLGLHLHQNKTVIAIAGTHGKSTTTALTGLVLQAANLDPTVEVGATVKEWDNNVRIGSGEFFISEADEFHNNFEFFHPRAIILNNIEMDHPEYFETEENLLKTFKNFLMQGKMNGTLIYNTDSPNNRKVVQMFLDEYCYGKPELFGGNLLPYSLSEVKIVSQSPHGTDFEYQNQVYSLSIPGLHNVSNGLGIIKLAHLLKISPEIINSAFKAFHGLSRRIELIGEKRNIKVYDDYANHPTAFRASIQGVKQLNPKSRVWIVIEPHTYSRLRAVLPQLPDALKSADHVIVSQIYASRETDPGDFTGQDIVTATSHPNSRYIPDFDTITSTLRKEVQSTDVILVCGSGNSYKLARQILSQL